MHAFSTLARHLLLLLVLLLLNPGMVIADMDAGWRQSFVEKGDVKLEIYSRGEGTPVFMHPSLGRPAEDFEDLGNRVVAAGYRVVLINPRGIGRSTGPMEAVSLLDLGSDVWMVADALGMERIFMLGQNFGNRVSRTVSSQQPGRVIGLMLLAAGGEIEPSKDVWAEFARVFDPILPAERHLQAVYHSFFAPGNDASVWADGWYGETAKLQTEAAKRTDFSQIYFGGTAPALVIQGLDDKIAPPQNAWNFVTRRPNARLVAFPNMGHAMLPENPEGIANAVIDFIKHQPASGYGADLYQIVKSYSDMGFHRVGTDVDTDTVEWFSRELERRGGKVERQPFDFKRFNGSSTVTIDGETVLSMPLYYEGVGEVQSNHPYVAAVVAMAGDRNSQAIEDVIADAKASGATIAVIATLNPDGELATPNRYPKIESGLPVVLVPGRYADALKIGRVNVQYSAKLVPGKSENVVAAFGDVSHKPLVIATPLSGWFNCAAERATGIAIALGLAQRLAPKHGVLVVGSPGHEILHHIGLESYLAHNQVDASLILHLGANVALGEKDPATGNIGLAPGVNDLKAKPQIARTLFVRMDSDQFAVMKPSLLKADLPAVLNPPEWNGEGALWAKATTSPLMSFVGIGPLFHTPADIPENVTSPEILELVYESISESVEAFVENDK